MGTKLFLFVAVFTWAKCVIPYYGVATSRVSTYMVPLQPVPVGSTITCSGFN